MSTPSPRGRDANALLIEADAVLALAPELRVTAAVADLPRLRAKIAQLLREFEMRTFARGVGKATLARAQAVLSALIDDVVRSMPWGADAGWEPLQTSLPAWQGQDGKEGPDPALLRVARAISTDGAADRDLLELTGAALALGPEGRGAAATGEELVRIRAQLAARLRAEAPGAGRVLSAQWRAAVGRSSALASWLPLWVMSAVAAALLAMLYLALVLLLGARSDRVYAQIAALRPAATTPHPLPAPQARLAGLSSMQLASRQLVLREEIDRSVVLIPDVGLFEPGTATLLPAGLAPLRAVAGALRNTPGRVLVLGHTDGKAPRSARYQSDWDLSVERALAVHDALRGFGVEAGRLGYDGRADTEPLPAADPVRSEHGNGRIEIVLLVGR